MMNTQWLDTKTRALLCDDDVKSTLTATDAFSLLLLYQGADTGRVHAVVTELGNYGTPNMTPFPFVARQGLALDDAVAGQSALACCDCVAVFVRDDVVAEMQRDDFAELFSELVASPEFQPARVEIVSLRTDEVGHRFLWMFLGLAVGIVLPIRVVVMRKKARLMKHWGDATGSLVRIVDDNSPASSAH
ncbi:MAG: hypothetical protein ACYC3X_23100 [Pirellulaceae bacterium]